LEGVSACAYRCCGQIDLSRPDSEGLALV
jgi:hypothetical protein